MKSIIVFKLLWFLLFLCNKGSVLYPSVSIGWVTYCISCSAQNLYMYIDSCGKFMIGLYRLFFSPVHIPHFLASVSLRTENDRSKDGSFFLSCSTCALPLSGINSYKRPWNNKFHSLRWFLMNYCPLWKSPYIFFEFFLYWQEDARINLGDNESGCMFK